LPNLDFISKLDGIISADICAGGKINYEILKYIDYLFIADEDLEISLKELVNLTKGCVICHSSNGSIVAGKDYWKNFEITKIDNLNVLGAGDYFAISFIINMLESANLELSIKKAHTDATNYLLRKNNLCSLGD
jgi:sugar/nucleoside kinase (ribokinase family)